MTATVCIIAVLPASAQVLSGLSAMPLIGDTFMTHAVDYGDVFDTGTEGTGSTWDFSDLVTDQNSYIIYASIDPLTAPGHAAFPMSDVVLKGWPGPGTSAVFHDYYDSREEGLYKVGGVSEAFLRTYGTPDLYQAIPLFYGGWVNTPFCYTLTGFSDPVDICGGTEQTVDADGTLIMPYGALPYTVRTRHERYEVNDDAPTDTSFSTVYRWWAPDVRWPVLEMGTSITTDGTVLHSAVALDAAIVLGIADAVQVHSRVFPVPFEDRLTIDVSPALLKAGVILVRAADGRLVHSSAVSGGARTVALDLGGLPAGPLFIEIDTDHGRVVHKAVHQP